MTHIKTSQFVFVHNIKLAVIEASMFEKRHVPEVKDANL